MVRRVETPVEGLTLRSGFRYHYVMKFIMVAIDSKQRRFLDWLLMLTLLLSYFFWFGTGHSFLRGYHGPVEVFPLCIRPYMPSSSDKQVPLYCTAALVSGER